jgi:ActR/RegA family two-component response regulator
MKILIFENMFEEIRLAFESVNQLYFDNDLTWEVYAASQDFDNFENIDDYDYILIDIDLSRKSRLDGYSLINKFLDHIDESKLIVLTGHTLIKESLKSRDLPELKILSKPIDFEDIYNILS